MLGMEGRAVGPWEGLNLLLCLLQAVEVQAQPH